MNPEDLQNLARDARPRMSWRIGISGHIELPADGVAEFQKAVERIFADIEATLRTLQAREDSSALFSPGPPVIALISPLAVGADRLAAELAAKRGYELRVPLPFSEAEYKRDFPSTVNDFERLQKYAQGKGAVIALDGRYDSDATRNQGYMDVGEFVVRNCDLLIAIWNGKTARGLGGTALVVDHARDCGVPVVHVETESQKPNKPRGVTFLGPVGAEAQDYSSSGLSALIEAQVMPKARASHGAESHEEDAEKRTQRQLRAAKRYFCEEPLVDHGHEPDFLYNGPFSPRMPIILRGLSRLFSVFVRLFGNGVATAKPIKREPPCGKTEQNTRYLFLHHHRADALASFYANVHRSAFLLVYALGAAALSCAVAALFYFGREFPFIGIHSEYVFTGLELIILVVLAALVRLDYTFRWRDRWLEYRLLAELLREADLLAQIGRPMPIARIDEMAEDLPGRAWVRNAYCAIVRRAGLVPRNFDAAFLADLRDYAADTRLTDQIAYHEKAVSRNETVAKALRYVGIFAFVATVVAAIVKLSWHHVAEEFALGLFAGVLPALAYACFGIRNQAEFEIVSRRSERMIVKLERHKQRIKALAGKDLTSEALGREILHAAAVMRHDAADWASIFEVKETDI